MINIEFKFEPGQLVKIVLFDLNYPGRIGQNIYDYGVRKYLVEYSDDKGDLRSHQFYEDEIRAIE